MWSLGVILFVLISQEFPFGADDDVGFVSRLLEGKLVFGPRWDKISAACRDLVKCLVNVDPEER